MCAVAVSAPRPVSSDPKPREGTETFRRQFVDHEFSESSDPKPREGTETHPTRYRWRASFIESSDPKPREGTETHIGDGDAARGHAESSDPKPREGTETTPRVVPSVSVLLVVRPKTPRGDGNLNTEPCTCRGSGVSSDPKPREGTETFLTTCAGLAGLGRQTQNPERGRKHQCVVISGFNFSLSSDPKPREGTET